MNQDKYIKNNPKIVARSIARLLDYCFFYSLFILPLFFTSLIPHDFLHIAIILFIPFLWIPFETFLVHIFGTTIGKSLLGIHLRHVEGQKLSLKTSFKRAFNLWAKGLAFNLFPFSLISSFYYLKKLKKNKIFDWDKNLSIDIYTKKKTKFKTFFAGILLFIYSIFFFTEYELREVLISDKNSFTPTYIFNKDIFHKDLFKSENLKWVLFKDPSEAFDIRFPSTPETKESVLPTTSGKDALPFSEIKLSKEDVEYNLSYTTLPKSITKWSSYLILKGSLKLLSKHVPGGAKIHKKTSSTYKKHPSIDFILIKKGGFESYGRLVLIGSKLYKIEVTYPSHKKESIQENLNIFMQSFEPRG